MGKYISLELKVTVITGKKQNKTTRKYKIKALTCAPPRPLTLLVNRKLTLPWACPPILYLPSKECRMLGLRIAIELELGQTSLKALIKVYQSLA